MRMSAPGTPKLLAGIAPARHEGDGAPRSANLWFRDPLGPRRAPLGAPVAATSQTGRPRFRHECPACDPRTVSSPSPFLRFVKRLGRSDRGRLAWTPRSSANSWQGFLMSPGGAPAAARVPVLRNRPAGAAPRPACTTPREERPSVDEVCRVYGRMRGWG